MSIAASASEQGAQPRPERTISAVSEGAVSIAASASEQGAQPRPERTISAVSERPLIVLTSYAEPVSWGIWRDVPGALLPMSYVDQVIAAGGAPVLLPPVPEAAEAALAAAHGLLLTGGPDVAANHGGEVRLWSRPGTGSTFTIRLPAHGTVFRPVPVERDVLGQPARNRPVDGPAMKTPTPDPVGQPGGAR